MSLTPRRKENPGSFGRKPVAPCEPTPGTGTPGEADDAAAGEARLDLARATLALDDGLLMVLGPEGDPVPPAALAALAADQPEAMLGFADGTRVPAGRVADVLAAQTLAGGRLPAAGEQPEGWLDAMLGLVPAPAMASIEELDAERDDPEIMLFGNELVVSTAAAGAFVLAAARPDASRPPAARLAEGDGTPVGLEDLLARLRLAAGLDADGDARELALPGCGFARDGDALVLTTAQGETFVVSGADVDTRAGVALYTPDGERVSLADLADALGLGDAGPKPMAASMDEEPILDEEAPASPHPGPDSDGEESAADDKTAAPANTTLRLACPIDDVSNVAVVLITGVPAGAALSAGTDNGDGSWTVSPDQLDALAITTPADTPGPLTLEARLVAIDDRNGDMSSAVRKVVASPKAGDGAVQPGEAEAGIRLDLGAVVHEAADGRPVSAVVVGGLPAGAELSAGQFDEAIRSWVIKPGELEGVRLYPGARSRGPCRLRVTVVTADRGAGRPSATTRSIEVGPVPTLDPAADRPPERVGGVGFFRPRYDRRG